LDKVEEEEAERWLELGVPVFNILMKREEQDRWIDE
jgi:hypothetical protein